MACKEKYPSLGNHFDWSLGYIEDPGEFFDAPSMCEPVHNLSLEEIVRDYSRGILHPSLTPLYDDGEDIQEVDPIDDLVDIFPEPMAPRTKVTLSDDPGKTPTPAATPEPDDSSPEQ